MAKIPEAFKNNFERSELDQEKSKPKKQKEKYRRPFKFKRSGRR